MKIHNITEGYSYMSDVDPQPEQSVVDKFAGVADSQRSYYIMKWAEEKGMKTDDAMFKAGYIKDGYIGAGAWNWRYVGMGESVQEAVGEYSYTLEYNGERNGYTVHKLSITSPEGETKEVADDFTYFETEEQDMQAELESWFNNGHGVGDESMDEVAGAKDCWDGYKKDGTQAGTGKNKGKRVNKCVKEDEDEVEGADYSQDGMIGTPDGYYDAEDRQEAFRDLKDALDGAQNWQEDSIKDGVCPECAGSGYMDGEETFTNDDGEEEESSECYGWGNFGCDEGEMTQRDDGLPNWAEIAKHDKRQAEKANRGPAPSQEQIMKILPRLHDEYVKSGRYNAFELGSILRQMYPELGKRQASSYVADFFKTFEEQAELRKLAGIEVTEEKGRGPTGIAYSVSQGHPDAEDPKTGKKYPERQSAEYKAKFHKDHPGLKQYTENTKDEQLPHCHLCKGKGCDDCDGTGEDDGYAYGTKGDTTIKEGDSDEAVVSKMLAKALGDENKWTEMSAPELYAELESTNPEVADMISKVAKMLYDVKLQERVYKDVGVADTVKDQRGKEFNFDKNTKKFKSQDGEEADVKTKLGKDLMRIRKNQMKKTTPSYKTKKNQGLMASIEEAYGDSHEITLEDNEDFNDVFGVLGYSLCEQDTFEAEYQGRKVKLNKPMQGDVKKFKVYVKDPKTGNTKKVNFGHGGSSVKGKAMKIRKSNPKARKSFRARHNCDNPGPKTKARYWSCRKW